MDVSGMFFAKEECDINCDHGTWKSHKKRKKKKQKEKNCLEQPSERERDSKRRKNYEDPSSNRNEKLGKTKNLDKEKKKHFKRKKGTLTMHKDKNLTSCDSHENIKESNSCIDTRGNLTIESLSSQKSCPAMEAETRTEKNNLEKVKERKRTKKSKRSRKESSSVGQKEDKDNQNCNKNNGTGKSIRIDGRMGALTQRLNPDEMINQEVQDLDNNPLHSNWNFSTEEIKCLRKQGIKVKIGSWSEKETETLKQNMEEYLRANGLTDPAPLIYRKDYDDKESQLHAKRTLFYQNLAKGIDRPLFHVYKRVLRMYDPKNYGGNWTEADENLLLRYHALYGDQWTKIGKLLGRSGMAVNHKYLRLQKSTPGYCKWTKEEIDLLNGAVRAATNTDFETQIYSSINWTTVSEFVGSRTPEQCRTKWLSDVCWVNVNGEKNKKWNNLDDVNLIERLYCGPETDENDVDWVKMTGEFSNSPSRQWLRLRWFALKKVVPNNSECDFEELLDYLYNVHRPLLKGKISKDDEGNASVE